MKRMAKLLVLGLVLTFAPATHAEKLLGGVPETSSAPVKTKLIRGDFCWSVEITDSVGFEDGPPNFTVKLRITPVNRKESYIVHGVADVPGTNPPVLGGTAFVAGGEMFANLTVTHEDTEPEWRDAGIVQARLDRSTLNGSLWAVLPAFNRSKRVFGLKYFAGTMTNTSCP